MGNWQPITSGQVYGRVRALAEVMKGWGVAKGDRVAILSENRWEWAVTDFAVLAVGGIDVPLYGDADAGAGGVYAAGFGGEGGGGVDEGTVREDCGGGGSCRICGMWW